MLIYRYNATALHEAVDHNHVEMAALLLQHGADVNAKNKCPSRIQLLRDRSSRRLQSCSSMELSAST